MTGTPLEFFFSFCIGKGNGTLTPFVSLNHSITHSLTHSLTHSQLPLTLIRLRHRSFSVTDPLLLSRRSVSSPLRLQHRSVSVAISASVVVSAAAMKMKNICLLVFFLILSSSVLFLSSLFSYSSNSDKIDHLPQQPEVKFNQYSGYITVDEIQKRFLFYYFVEAEVQPSLKPVVMWLHGGPGCSSVGLGAFQEHGPFQPTDQGLAKNNYSWNKEANMLYLDSPAGAGFSYSANKSFYNLVTDETTARDNLVFLQQWFTKFSHYKNNEFFITGESYTGHFAPQLAALILQTKTNINLKGIAIGNPLLEFNTDYNSRGQFLWSHGLITYSTYELVTKVCNYSRITREYRSGTVNSSCVEVIDRLNREVGDFIDDFDVSQDMCRPLGQHIWTLPHGEKKRAFCLEDKIFNYLNKKGVQKALHTRISSWQTCGAIWYDSKSIENSTISLLGTLVKSGVRVMVFSGDQDSVIPFFSTQSLLDGLAKDLGLYVGPYRPWYNGIKVAGFTQVYGDILTFATVRGAGHSCAYSKPEETFLLFKTFLEGWYLPKIKL
ncbi:serine carboxypeptidase-like 45 [Cicer arietinum]